MTYYVAFALLVGLAVGCGRGQTPITAANKKGTIVVYKDGNDTCKTMTTPYMKLQPKPSKAEWKIDDEFGCLTSTTEITLEFPSGGLYACNGVKGHDKIECDLSSVTAPAKAKYKVQLGNQTEDPELEIGS